MSSEELKTTFCEKIKKAFSLWYAKIPFAYLLLLIVTYHYGRGGELEQGIVVAYSTLVAIDLSTKWLALSHQHLVETGVPEERITFIDRFNGIVLAFNAGKINSPHLIKGFATKMALFYFILMATRNVGTISKLASLEELALTFVALNELLSILENLRDLGNKRIGVLINFVQAKMDGKMK